jgi:serine/threonine protein kinase
MVERLGTLKESDVIAWMIQISDVLIYLHNNNPPIIHRDIKPANVRIMPKGKAILVDFGIAKTYDPARQTTLGARGVTPGFSPIEQYGHGGTDARSDIYSLGATMYFCLTRKEPPESTRRADQSQPEYLVPPRQTNSSISSDLEHLILGTLELFKHQRIQTAQEVRDTLINIRRGLPPTLPVPPVSIAPTTPVPPNLAQPGVPAKISGVLQYISQPRIFSDGYSKKHYEFTVEVQPGVCVPCTMEGYMLPVYSLFNGANVQVDGVLGTNNIFQVVHLTETQNNRTWTPKAKIGWVEQLKITLGLTNP